MKNKKDCSAAGFYGRLDRGGERGCWKRDLALALLVAIGIGLAGAFAAARADGSRLVEIGGKLRTAMLTVTLGNSQDVRTDNQGYWYMLHGDYKRAREKLYEARAKDPGNRFVENNLHLLSEASVSGEAIE